MNKIEQQIQQLEKEVAALKLEYSKELAELKEADEWPKDGEFYWITVYGGVEHGAIPNSMSGLQEVGNIFRTREQAEAHAKRLASFNKYCQEATKENINKVMAIIEDWQ